MNLTVLSGNVGQDPKITNFENGGKVAQFTLATNERAYKTKEGKEIPEETTWHNIVVRKTGLAGVCEQYVKKGTPLLIEGKIKTRSYTDNAGQTRYVTEIFVEEMELLGGQKRETAPAPEPEYRPSNPLTASQVANAPSGGYNPIPGDDDLPAGF